jgi:polyisoprenoid-binding protein YceI
MQTPRDIFLPLAAALLAISACDNQPGEGKPKAVVQEAAPQTAQPSAAPAPGKAQVYAFSQENSKIEFVGAKVTGKHNGAFKTFSGSIQVPEGAAPTQGTMVVEIDMASLVADVDKLTQHLKSPELLDAVAFPKARFNSTAISAQAGSTFTVSGNFELHGVSKQISFPATIKQSGDSVEADAEFAINRKDFGVVYPGKPDDLIQDDVLIKLFIRAPRSQG